MTLQFHPQAKGNTQSGHDHGEMIAKIAKRCESVTRYFVLAPAALQTIGLVLFVKKSSFFEKV